MLICYKFQYFNFFYDVQRISSQHSSLALITRLPIPRICFVWIFQYVQKQIRTTCSASIKFNLIASTFCTFYVLLFCYYELERRFRNDKTYLQCGLIQMQRQLQQRKTYCFGCYFGIKIFPSTLVFYIKKGLYILNFIFHFKRLEHVN